MVSADHRQRYGRIAAHYDLFDWPFEPLYRPGRALIGDTAAGVTFELGAGTGKNFPHYHAARVTASDLSWPMLMRARRRLRPPVRGLVVADATHLPLLDASVDTVVATFVCCVLPDPMPALGEIARVLRPGGQAVFLECVLPAHGWQRTLMQLLEPSMRTLYGVRWNRDLRLFLDATTLRLVRTYVWHAVIRCIVSTKPGQH